MELSSSVHDMELNIVVGGGLSAFNMPNSSKDNGKQNLTKGDKPFPK